MNTHIQNPYKGMLIKILFLLVLFLIVTVWRASTVLASTSNMGGLDLPFPEDVDMRDSSATEYIYGKNICLARFTPVTAPSSQAHSILFSSVQSNQMTISWTRGNGSAVAVFMKATTSGTAAPVNNTSYTANTVFGSGSQIGATGWYCVYNSSGTNTTVTGLSASTTYRVHACERNTTPEYNTTSATNNPNNQVTAVPAGTAGLWKTSAASTDWGTGSNWDDGNVPGAGTNVVIPNATNEPILDATRAVNNLTVQTNGSLTISGAYTLTVNGNLEVQDGGVITISNASGVLDVTGTYNKVGTGAIAASSGGKAIIGGNLMKGGAVKAAVSSDIEIRSSITMPD